MVSCLSWFSCNSVWVHFNYDHLSPIFLIIAQPCVAQNTHYQCFDRQNINALPILCVDELSVTFKTTLLWVFFGPLFEFCMQCTDTALWLPLEQNLSCMWPFPVPSCDFCVAGRLWMFLLLSGLPIILAASQQMVWWWCRRSGHVAASSALCPLYRPLPRHPMTNYFLFVTETQSSEGRGIFCCLSYQTNLRLFPPVGHSLTGSLFLRSLIGDIGRQREGEIWFGAFKTVTWWIFGSICRPSGSCVRAGSGVSLVTRGDLQYH